MVDINLFSPYIEEERESKYKNLYIIIGIASFIVISSLYTGWYFHSVNKLEKNIAEMNSYLSSEGIKTQLSELKQKQTQIKILDEYSTSVSGINNKITQIDVINTDIIEEINFSIPSSIYFDSMSIADRIVEIHGTTKDRSSLAQFQQTLNNKIIFSNVYITSMTKDTLNDNYVFVLTSIIEGDKNEIE
ncbi:PilN domain-containing protein [Clostridium sp. D2Q-11]|uniref:PilN domain-containing protein n=1 Tax=Anaeromonas frigoriresistens TaxID=2683708 RepID=A0A942ZA98_9FIRM|nr:PilN domain-containing protein [Anaeromonas frigoriresistens]MBS4540009.1 PilN domain-containing protein [Anaeromonas frigoriresistens]